MKNTGTSFAVYDVIPIMGSNFLSRLWYRILRFLGQYHYRVIVDTNPGPDRKIGAPGQYILTIKTTEEISTTITQLGPPRLRILSSRRLGK